MPAGHSHRGSQPWVLLRSPLCYNWVWTLLMCSTLCLTFMALSWKETLLLVPVPLLLEIAVPVIQGFRFLVFLSFSLSWFVYLLLLPYSALPSTFASYWITKQNQTPNKAHGDTGSTAASLLTPNKSLDTQIPFQKRTEVLLHFGN